MLTYKALNALHPLILCIDSGGITSTFWLIILNIQWVFNPIFLNAENQSFLTVPSNFVYVNTVDVSHKISNAFNAKMYWQCRHC